MAQEIVDLFKKITGHAKEYGFIYPSSEIYDGLSAVYDYGPNGVELKNNIKQFITITIIIYIIIQYLFSLLFYFKLLFK